MTHKAQTINGDFVEGFLNYSSGLKGLPPKGYYISNGYGMPWAYAVRPETIVYVGNDFVPIKCLEKIK